MVLEKLAENREARVLAVRGTGHRHDLRRLFLPDQGPGPRLAPCRRASGNCCGPCFHPGDLHQRRLDARAGMQIHVPYARFQSVMFDKDTLIVSYDRNRGEPRGSRKRSLEHKDLAVGDCVRLTNSVCRSAPPASISATACSTSASAAPCVSMPAIRSWINGLSGGPDPLYQRARTRRRHHPLAAAAHHRLRGWCCA